jgi:hypothetical protein
MESFFKRVDVKLIELEKKRSWLLAQAKIKPSTWSSWVRFGRMPPADSAVAVADTLGVSVEFLVTGRETVFDLRRGNPMALQIGLQLLELNEQQLRRVTTLVNTLRLEDAGK